MTTARFTHEQIIGMLLSAHDGRPVAALCQEQGITPATFYAWRRKHADQLYEALTARFATVESENQRLEMLAQDGDMRQVTVLLSDLRGFTAISERYPPTRIVRLLNRYFGLMTRIILDHGGTIDKFMGDAIMALFGAPLQHPDDVAQALACAVEMQIAMETLNRESAAEGMDPLFMGIGINTGDVIAGHLGSPLHSEYTVIGDEVNLASRIEAHTLRGQILISENTFMLAREFIEVGAANEVAVKGKLAPVRMYELLGLHRPRPLKVPRRESRRSPRVLVDLPVRFQVIDDKTVLPAELGGTIADLGYGGLRMTSAARLDAFTDIRILHLSSLPVGERTAIYAKVRRVTLGEVCSYHLEFTSVDPDTYRALKAHIDALVQRR